ncbi:hypothetical protein JW948_09280, partial [bacterium]|nr:hypothetical protein [bacterium]
MKATLVFLLGSALLFGIVIQASGAAGDENWDTGFSIPGVNGDVYAVCADGGNVYVGGCFNIAGDVHVTNIARWDGSRWHAMGDGLTATSIYQPAVKTIAVVAGIVYAGGEFNASGAVALSNIARWNGSTWTGVGGGCSGGVFALIEYQGNLVAGGAFTASGSMGPGNLARWTGTTWTGLGSGVNGPVNAMAADGSHLYVTGDFTQAGAVAANRVA